MKQNETIIIVDDERDLLVSTKSILREYFDEVLMVDQPEKIISILKKTKIDKVLLDMNFKRGYNTGKEGLKWLQKIKSQSPGTAVFVMTAFGDIDLAVEAMKLGASDFILKPLSDTELIEKLSRQNNHSQRKDSADKSLTPDIAAIYKSLNKVAPTDASILVKGENGTGKTALARYIHSQSKRKSNSFIHIDLGAIPETLFEAELFGYKKGAFTGANSDKKGLLELSNGGTAFLDEVSNLPFHLQSKLLTVLQERTFYRLGDPNPQTLDTRFIFATNANLQELIAKREFRQDLFYRMNTIEIEIPPLRTRPNDIRELALFYLDEMCSKHKISQLKITPSGLQALTTYAWPGNIRELSHTIERSVLLSESKELDASDFNLLKAESLDSMTTIENAELEAIEKALKQTGNNITDAAQKLGIGRTTLYRKMKKYGLSQ